VEIIASLGDNLIWAIGALIVVIALPVLFFTGRKPRTAKTGSGDLPELIDTPATSPAEQSEQQRPERSTATEIPAPEAKDITPPTSHTIEPEDSGGPEPVGMLSLNMETDDAVETPSFDETLAIDETDDTAVPPPVETGAGVSEISELEIDEPGLPEPEPIALDSVTTVSPLDDHSFDPVALETEADQELTDLMEDLVSTSARVDEPDKEIVAHSESGTGMGDQPESEPMPEEAGPDLDLGELEDLTEVVPPIPETEPKSAAEEIAYAADPIPIQVETSTTAFADLETLTSAADAPGPGVLDFDENELRLVTAQTVIDMGQAEQAKDLLERVRQTGNDDQVRRAELIG